MGDLHLPSTIYGDNRVQPPLINKGEVFWVEAPTDLFRSLTLIPTTSQTTEERFNTLTRLVIVISLVLCLFRIKWWFAFLIVGILLLAIIYYNTVNREKIERFTMSGTWAPHNTYPSAMGTPQQQGPPQSSWFTFGGTKGWNQQNVAIPNTVGNITQQPRQSREESNQNTMERATMASINHTGPGAPNNQSGRRVGLNSSGVDNVDNYQPHDPPERASFRYSNSPVTNNRAPALVRLPPRPKQPSIDHNAIMEMHRANSGQDISDIERVEHGVAESMLAYHNGQL